MWERDHLTEEEEDEREYQRGREGPESILERNTRAREHTRGGRIGSRSERGE